MIDPERLREQAEVGVGEVAVDVALAVELELVLADEGKGAVVDHHHVERDAVVHCRHHFHAAHLEAAVAEDGEGGAVFRKAARADGGRDCVAERRDAGIREVAVAVGNVEVALCEDDVIVEHQRVVRKALGESAEESLHQVEGLLRLSSAVVRGLRKRCPVNIERDTGSW